ncbi:MAG: 5-formyltetrahydrofolate cyclo-ligase [Thalassobaculum sp.]|uniref:5-formyltetrahydrofolate cyclo-ligase n=1 Tax=Thalassobaculum sp. TaxID=2022740 RepID=UPI0032EEE17E
MSYASPPCFAHELASAAAGVTAVDPVAAADVARWRKAERARLIAARLRLSSAERRRVSRAVAGELGRFADRLGATVVGVYWPFRGELDLVPWMRTLAAGGTRVALPVVHERGRPLVFREWWPGCRLERGIWNIPVPAEGPPLIPDLVVAPVVGFDHDCYRLGYGGGYFDRTLAALSPRPTAVGVGHLEAGIATIYPQPHDIPMDAVITGDGQVMRRGRG